MPPIDLAKGDTMEIKEILKTVDHTFLSQSAT